MQNYELQKSKQVCLLLHLLPGGVGIEQSGMDIGMSRLVCQLADAVSILQSIGAEEMPESVRRDGSGVCIEDPVDLASGKVAIPPSGE